MFCRFGGFCEGIDKFDAEMFRFAPAEAAATDPAQRQLMEQTALALSDASGNGSHVGSFTGETGPLIAAFGTHCVS